MLKPQWEAKVGHIRQGGVDGFVVGIVTNIVHEEGDYRVKVRFPLLPNGGQSGEESHWCRIVSYMAGKDRGTFWLPEVEDEVLVGFIHGDFNQGVILGGFWNGVDKAIYNNKEAKGKALEHPFTGKHDAKKNDLRITRSRIGHQLVFNDNADGSRVALHSQQKHRIVLDDQGNEPSCIEIYDGKEENFIRIDTKNKKIRVVSKLGDIEFECQNGTFKVDAKEIDMKSSGDTSVRCANFKVSAMRTSSIKSNLDSELVANGGTLTLRGGPLVNIN